MNKIKNCFLSFNLFLKFKIFFNDRRLIATEVSTAHLNCSTTPKRTVSPTLGNTDIDEKYLTRKRRVSGSDYGNENFIPKEVGESKGGGGE